jgi:hypothetical protein
MFFFGGSNTPPNPLPNSFLANKGKVSTLYSARKKTKREEWEASIIALLSEGGGEGVGKNSWYPLLFFFHGDGRNSFFKDD